MPHIPVLKKEVIKYLAPRSDENFIDCTFGDGGHSLEIIKKILPKGRVLGIDWDEEMIRRLKLKAKSYKIKDNLLLVCDNFANLKEIVEKYDFWPVHGILLDLGMSSWHLERSGRGFSFQKDEPLVMRYCCQNQKSKIKNQNENVKCKKKLTAGEILNKWPGREIEKILREYGEEKFAKRIAKEIVRTREKTSIQTTFQLKEIIKKATPSWYHHQKRHFATKTFQALRIAVNKELENLERVLPQTLEVLEKGGRLVIISFQSLEDRLVKEFFKKQALENQIKILTPKPIRPRLSEITSNPSSRSAKLRAAEKI